MIVPQRAEIAVLIGLVSTEDKGRILEALDSLAHNQGGIACEVILVDRRGDELSKQIAARHPSVRLIDCAPNMTLPEMRTVALESSSAAIVAVTEDHCVPCDNWLGQILLGLRDPGIVAVGGCVANGIDDTPFDWATFLCEYSFFHPPVAEGRTDVLPGMNVAYCRSALERIPRERLTAGFWETTVHPLLLKQGGRFVSLNAMRMNHCKRFSVGLFLRQRYLYSRYYAGIRFRRGDILHRCIAAGLSVILPPLLLWRMRKSAQKKGLHKPFWRALPSLCLMVTIWAFGEIVGYLAGPGSALAEIE